eukprot:CAMPEP_0114474426 /NCGR_PEP_ID=MMETSP0104-20121206/13563_1 /TAXON_ID=37642 ORGANISM="Paraphysomonas imperforata, Strain PA2" /NCGR_SAMPLE_ID=MMETSP0104 /ASSEMBLY_ACC=CAM_ASM_000202 /LENGTH=204 /DNA_ID=CAMNT_0001648785 /DNA_START=62 /DNA_END=676 /DNA_ORIENTATION=+
MASVAFTGVWWSIGFWDCVGNDFFYSIILDEGICFGSDGNIADWQDDNCVEFDSSAFDAFSEDGDTYEAANGLVQTAMSLLIISLLVTVAQFFPLPDTIKKVLRLGSLALAALSTLFFFIPIVSASNTDVTDVDNDAYSLLRAQCSSNGTIPNGAWVMCLLAMLITPCMGFCMYKPLKQCAGEASDTETTLIEARTSTSTTNTK